MPYYKISFTLSNPTDRQKDQPVKTYRQYKETDIDRVWHLVEKKCREKWNDRLIGFDCVIFSKRSPDYQEYLLQIGAKKRTSDTYGTMRGNGFKEMGPERKKGPGKYR